MPTHRRSDSSLVLWGCLGIALMLAAPIAAAGAQAPSERSDPPPDDAPGFPPDLAPSPSSPDPPELLSEPPGASIPPAPAQGSTAAWTPIGPAPATDGQVENIGADDQVVGAIHTVVAHPSDPDVLWIGAVNGGIWKTTNATAGSPTWTPLTDDQPSLSIGALELDPTDGTHQTLVGGFGRYSSLAQIGGPRTGLLRTTNGGTTWTLLDGAAGANPLTGSNVSGVAPRGSTLVVSASNADPVGGSLLCSDLGVFRSTDTGATFAHATSSGVTLRGFFYDLASDPASTSTLWTAGTFVDVCDGGSTLFNGVYRSTDTGATWTRVSSAAMDALIVDGVTNNVEIAAHGDDVYVNIIQIGQSVGIFHTGNGTVGSPTWTAMDLPRTPEGTPGTVTGASNATPIVITASAPHGLFTGDPVLVEGVLGNTAANGEWKITRLSATTFGLNGSVGNGAYTGGGTFQLFAGLNPREKPGSQGGLHASIRVYPNDVGTKRVAVGGDRQDNPLPNFIGAADFSGRLFRGDPTVGATGDIPSAQWEHLTHSDAVAEIPGGGTASGSAPHADSREAVFDAGGDLIQVDDGGIYRRTSPENATGDWFSLNGSLQVTEQHDVAWDSVSHVAISGNQDTGTTEQAGTGSPTWRSVSTGDGGDVAVDDLSGAGAGSPFSIRYSSFQNLGLFRRRTVDAANAVLLAEAPALVLTSGATPFANFITPVVLNSVDPSRLLIVGCNAVYESPDQGDTIAQVSGLLDADCDPGILSFPQNAVVYGGAVSGVGPDANVIWIGANSGAGPDVWHRGPSDVGLSFTPTAFPGLGIAPARDIVADPTDWETAYVVTSAAIYRTYDAGTTWETLTGNLTDTALQAAAIVAGAGSLVVGGGTGVFELPLPAPGIASSGPYTWTELGTGLPNARVFDLEYDAVDDVLIAGTLGRGAWILGDVPSGDCGFPDHVTVSNQVISGVRVDTACLGIVVGPDVSMASGADWTIRAGESIRVTNDSSFRGTVTFRIDPTLAPP